MSTTASSTKTGLTQAERVELSDRSMIEAAVRLIVERGTEKTTLKAIGEEAGYSRGLATYRFGSKSGLFEAVAKHLAHGWASALNKAVGEEIGIPALCTAVDLQCQSLVHSPENIRAMYILWYESVRPGASYRIDVARIHRHQRRDATAWIEAAIEAGEVRQDADPEAEAEQFCGSIFGAAYQWLVDPKRVGLQRIHEELKTTIRLRLEPR